jgi:hypothetical protein
MVVSSDDPPREDITADPYGMLQLFIRRDDYERRHGYCLTAKEVGSTHGDAKPLAIALPVGATISAGIF